MPEVWDTYNTLPYPTPSRVQGNARSFGCGYEPLAELTEVSYMVFCTLPYPTPIRVQKYARSFGCGYEPLAELTKVLDMLFFFYEPTEI